jgi:hypothetical protein
MSYFDELLATPKKQPYTPSTQPESAQPPPDPPSTVPTTAARPRAAEKLPAWATIQNFSFPLHIVAALQHFKDADGLKGKMAAFRNLTHLAWKATGKGKPLTRDETMQLLCITDPRRIEEYKEKYAALIQVENGRFFLILK